MAIERQDRIGVEVVAVAVVAVEIGAGIADRPVERVELRIVRAGHPGGAATRARANSPSRFPNPARRASARSRIARLLCRSLIEGGDESAHALIAARGAGDDQIADDERRGGAVVVLMPVGHLGFPEQLAVEAVQRDHVRVVGQHEDAIARTMRRRD